MSGVVRIKQFVRDYVACSDYLLRSTSGERNHNLAQAEKMSILWLIQMDAILDFSERVWVQVQEYLASSAEYRGCYMAVRRYGFYLRVLIICLTSERSKQVRDVFNTRRLNLYLQAAM